jgi:hypothetical protein
MSNPFQPGIPTTSAPPQTGWQRIAAEKWPGFRIEGDGMWCFASKCERRARLFWKAEEMRAAQCEAGKHCDPIRNHGRFRFQKNIHPLVWERD